MPTPASIAPPDLSTAAGILRFGNLFCDSKVLLTAVELGLFTALHDAPATEAQIRDRLGLNGRGVEDFLRVLAGIGALDERDGVYRNAPGADQFLVAGRPGFVGGFLMGAGFSIYPAYGRLAQALRTGKSQVDGAFEDLLDQPDALRQFAAMMDGLNESLAPALARAYDFGGHSRVLDVGGCRGNLVAHLLAAYPRLAGAVFDLPAMEPLCAQLLAERGLAGRVEFHGGDFFADDLPAADVMVCGHVLSDWNTDQRQLLLDKAYAALAPGGALLVYDRMVRPGPAEIENRVASLNLLLVTDGGGQYPVETLVEQAGAAGFREFSDRPLGDYDTLVVCGKG
jgi:SAM-dependent methyltransferase